MQDNLVFTIDKLIKKKKFDLAIKIYLDQITIDPKNFSLYIQLSKIYHEIKNYKEIINILKKASSLSPENDNITFEIGKAFHQLEDLINAEIYYAKTIEINNLNANAIHNLGVIENKKFNFHKAKILFERAIKINNQKDYYIGLANAYIGMKKFTHAINLYNEYLLYKKNNYIIFNNLGNIYQEMNLYLEALKYYQMALKLNSKISEIYKNIAYTQVLLNQNEQAIFNYKKALEYSKNDFSEIYFNYIFEKKKLLDIFDIDENTVLNKIKNNIIHPLIFTHLINNPKQHQLKTQNYINNKFQLLSEKKKKLILSNKINIGYFSSDFRNHAITHLIMNLIKIHDRSKFNIYGFDYSPNVETQQRQEILKNFDEVFNISNISDDEVINLCSDKNINIAIDLNGHTTYARTSLFLKRCAPIQVNYLGYPGTMGSNSYDYIIADKVVIPEKNQVYFNEKIAYLPNCYQANSLANINIDLNYTREDFGYPANEFLYCCFNRNEKISVELLNTWVEILDNVKNSSIVIFINNDVAKKNLANYFINKVNTHRIFYSSFTNIEDHLKRLSLNNLFLDTFPYNSHVTASDALYAGLPLLTIAGESFASRVASSLLNEFKLNEFICNDIIEYKCKAIDYGLNPQKLLNYKNKMSLIKEDDFFTSKKTARNLEKIFIKMIDQEKNNMKENIYV